MDPAVVIMNPVVIISIPVMGSAAGIGVLEMMDRKVTIVTNAQINC